MLSKLPFIIFFSSLSIVSAINLFMFLLLFYIFKNNVNIGDKPKSQNIHPFISFVILRGCFCEGNDLTFVLKNTNYLQVILSFGVFIAFFFVTLAYLMLTVDLVLENPTLIFLVIIVMETIIFLYSHALSIYYYRKIRPVNKTTHSFVD